MHSLAGTFAAFLPAPFRKAGAFLLFAAIVVGGCQVLTDQPPPVTPVDPDATEETRALYANLYQLADEAILLGHQDDLAYGYEWVRHVGSPDPDAPRSDVKAVTGSFPAVYGWDVGDLGNPGATTNLDSVPFDRMKRWIEEGYERGGVVTISWHMDNPVSGGSSWDTTHAAGKILPDSSHHEDFTERLDRFAKFVSDLQGGFWTWLGWGHDVPIIFRPYHEMTGRWFWWGATTPETYKRLFRFTVEYLRDEKGLDNLLYAYSTDVFESREHYLEHYPGDEYVDVVGFDDYGSIVSDSTRPVLVERLRTVSRVAQTRNKVVAFTETGFEEIPDSTWWTDTLLPALMADSLTRDIAYVHLWRNANNEIDVPDHYFVPYPGHPSADNFVEFRNDPLIYVEEDLPDLYD